MFNFAFIGIFIFSIGMFIAACLVIFNPKIRGKMMSNQVKSLKYMMDEVKDDIEDISTDMADATKEGIKITTKAFKEGIIGNEEDLEELSTKMANASKEGIKIRARAFKEGLKDDFMFCKHCGSEIDKDSKFCKECGKEQ